MVDHSMDGRFSPPQWTAWLADGKRLLDLLLGWHRVAGGGELKATGVGVSGDSIATVGSFIGPAGDVESSAGR